MDGGICLRAAVLTILDGWTKASGLLCERSLDIIGTNFRRGGRAKRPKVKMTISIPCGEIPKTGWAGMAPLSWFQTDVFDKLERNGGHPVYGEKDISYRFNSHGYRCDEFDIDAAEIRVVSLGCSLVHGLGLPEKHLFHELFCDKIRSQTGATLVNWNLGVPGASNDYITRMLYHVVPILKPHILLINFTELSRRDFFTISADWLRYKPIANKKYWPDDLVQREAFQHLNQLSNPADDRRNFFVNCKAVEAYLQNTIWLASYALTEYWQIASKWFDPKHQVGGFRPDHELDIARDFMHPGPKSHQSLCTAYWHKFQEQRTTWDALVGGLKFKHSGAPIC